MLQQTQVLTVIPYYRRFIRRFPTLRKLASAREHDVLKAWEGLGYYGRARNLRNGAQVVVRDHGGRVPRDRAQLLEVPGIGEYTAHAILSLAFDQPFPVYDGNVRRVVARLLGLADPPPKLTPGHATERLLTDWIHEARSPGNFNQAMMELGQRVCLPRGPLCERCPLKGSCLAFRENLQNEIPRPRRRAPVPHYNVAIGVIVRNGRILIQKRPSEGLLGGLWEFPGGKIRRGERVVQALRRELREELGIEIEPGGKLAVVDHAYSHFSVTLHAIQCRLTGGRLAPKAAQAIRWVRPADLKRYPFPAANRKIFPALHSIQDRSPQRSQRNRA